MKKVLITMALLVGLSGFAQHKGHRGHKEGNFKDMTPEQVATLATKKLALALDLTENQQQQVMQFNLENAEFRKAKMEERKEKKESGELTRPTADERFEMANAQLDRKLAQQEKMKQILNAEQYEKWKQLSHKKHKQGKKRMQSRRG